MTHAAARLWRVWSVMIPPILPQTETNGPSATQARELDVIDLARPEDQPHRLVNKEKSDVTIEAYPAGG